MGVYLRDTASTWVPGPINVADELYNQDLPDLSTDPDVIAGGSASVDEVDQRVGASVGTVAGEIAGLKSRVDAVETGKANSVHTHTLSGVTDYPGHAIVSTPLALIRRSAEGVANVADPQYSENIANKRYVDTEVGKKANSSHAHTMSQISDMPVISASREGLAIARYDIDGRLQSNDPIYGANTTNKTYVDGLISALESRIEVLEGRLNAAGIPHLP